MAATTVRHMKLQISGTSNMCCFHMHGQPQIRLDWMLHQLAPTIDGYAHHDGVDVSTQALPELERPDICQRSNGPLPGPPETGQRSSRHLRATCSLVVHMHPAHRRAAGSRAPRRGPLADACDLLVLAGGGVHFRDVVRLNRHVREFKIPVVTQTWVHQTAEYSLFVHQVRARTGSLLESRIL